jgi:hypothetical protein
LCSNSKFVHLKFVYIQNLFEILILFRLKKITIEKSKSKFDIVQTLEKKQK